VSSAVPEATPEPEWRSQLPPDHESTADPAPFAAPAPSPGTAPPPGAEQPLHWRTSVLLTSAFGAVLLTSLAMLLPVPFVVLRPGPAINTLGSEGGHPLIKVTGHPTYPAKGALDLTTVTVSGGPGTRLSLFAALDAWFSTALAVVPEAEMYPPGQSLESSQRENAQEMTTSQESATVAALHTLGITIPTTITVAEVDSTKPVSPLRPHDVIIAVGGTPIADLSALHAQMAKVVPGAPVPITVRRGGADVTVTAPTRKWTDGRTVLGIQVDPTFRFPFDVKIQIDNVGGPSAGTMFALGIIDTLTPGDLTGGQRIAGTGTIDEDGDVGPIGGIQQKLVGARQSGATWFLVPSDDCKDISGHVPDGLRTVRISTLTDARQSVQRIGSGRDLALLPSCSS
jgi:PDZ domain-containing protein